MEKVLSSLPSLIKSVVEIKDIKAGVNYPLWASPLADRILPVPGFLGDKQRGCQSLLPSCCVQCYSGHVS